MLRSSVRACGRLVALRSSSVASRGVSTWSATSKMADSLVVRYYLHQGVFDPAELPRILETLDAPLPACFRINPNAPAASHIIARLQTEFPAAFASVQLEDGTTISPPCELSWFPEQNGAWQLDCGKTALAKLARDHTPLRAFRDFLLYHTAEGNITRQEAASMIPPLLLDVQPHHRTLDLCAAPGSKTSQVMEALQFQQRSDSHTKTQGFVVANDANEKRGYLLVHQLQRLGLTDAVVTCHDGQQFPGLYSRSTDAEEARLETSDVFDRIICDVPCTGDGTIRKNRNLWRQWTPGGALTLHNTQLSLATRAAELLRTDGLMVYSTCSLNPVENEAVVSELLRRGRGSLELVDCSDKLSGLKTRPGMSDWQVAWQPSKKKKKTKKNEGGSSEDPLTWFDSHDAVPSQLRGSRVVKSMFPPAEQDIRAQLERCLRIFPTDQNTGGFFVALIRKVNPIMAETGKSCWLESYEEIASRTLPVRDAYVCALCNQQTHTIRNCPLSRNMQRRREEEELQKKVEAEAQSEKASDREAERLHSYTKLRDDHWNIIKEFYGIDDALPHENLYGRSDGAASICLVSPHIQEACLAGHDLKILDTGVRVFARVPTSGDALVFRPTEDGLHLVLPFISKRKVFSPSSDLDLVLTAPTEGKSHSIENFSHEIQTQMADVRADSGVGPVLMLASEQTKAAQSPLKPLALPVWLGHKSLTLLVDEATRKRLQHGDGASEQCQVDTPLQ